jgi:hypothetical protein
VVSTYSLNSLALFFGDTDSLSSRRKWCIIISILAQELKELLGMLADQSSQLWVASSNLL